MTSSIQNIYRVLMPAVIFISGVLMASMFSGCATHESSTRRERVVTSAETTQPPYPVEGTTVQTQTKTDTAVESDSHESRGILSSAFHFIGAVLAFPFKIIGGAIEAIF